MIKLNWKEVETSQTIRGECRPRYSSQSFTMACGINVIVVIVACATAASAVLAPFPHGKTTVYNYRTEVRTTTSNESIYASQFVLQGTLDVTHDTRDPEQTNAYNVVLSNVVTDMHNGEIMDYDGKPVLQSIDGDAEVIQAPFLIIYNTNGTFQALKFGGNESRWSKNMKMAMAAMLQLDLPNENLANEPHSFVAQEKTIYGDCSVTYNVHPIERANSNAPEEFRVNKTFSPIDCDGFAVQEFNNVDNDYCKAKKPEDMFTESTRDVEIEKQGDGILIKKLNAYGVVRVLSASGASYPHFVVTNTMFEFIRVKEKSENDAQLGNFVTSPKIDHLTYRKPNANYAPNAAVDVTQGRHVLNVSRLSSHLEELLVQAFNYIDGDHFNPKEMNWNHVQTINKILHTMRYMDVDALQATFDRFENSDLRRNIQIKNIFLGVVAQVGTPASCHFTRNIILKNKISALSAVDMLTKLPLSVKVPTTELLAQMEDLAKFGAAIPAEVRKAGILSFASLIYRTFKNLPHPETNAVLNKYLHDFFDHVKNEPTNEMKVVYLMGIKNIQIGKIYDLLEPIIKGTQVITEDPERFLLLTIWAIDKAVEEDYTVANRILWPLMVNNTLSTKVRIAAYDILMNQAPDEKTARKVHEYVSTEGNEHFYNYHYTTLDSIARSVDQCKNDFRTIVKSILEETQYPRDADANIHYPLSGIHSISYASSGYTYAEKTDIGIVVNEFTGDSEVIKLEHETVDNDGSISDLSILVHIEGPDDFLRLVLPRFYPRLETPEVLEVLQKANSSVPAMKQPMMDIVLMRKGRVVIANHYNFETLEEISDNVLAYYFRMTGIATYNYQHVVFDRLYEKQLTSDIGVPIIIETRVPSVTSMQINHTNLIQRLPNFDVDIKFMKWMHGDYSMSVYNPMKDVWHAVRSVTATEVKLPFHSHITFGRYPNVLQFNFRDQVESKPEVAGFVILAKRLVTVDEEGTQKLMESCHTCLNQEYVYDGSRLVNETGKHRENNFDLKSLGLTGSSYTYRSEYGFLSERDLGYVKVLKTLFKSNISNSWMDVISETAMDARRLMTLITFDAQESLGGCIFRLEPSSQYPISEFNFNVRGKMEDNDKNETTGELLHSQTFRNSISFNTISSLTNTTAGSLNIDVDVDLSRGHLTNKASVQITKKTPEEQNLKICVDFSKNYPAPPADILKLGSTKEEIDSKITVSYGYTDGEECVQNETVISLTAKAQLSDEQKMRFKNDLENSVCNKQTKSPLYANPKNVVPRTVDCLNEAILYTTPRKYTVDVSHKMLSPRFASVVYDSLTDGVVPSETGNFQFRAEFPMTKNNIDFQFMTNTSGFRNLIFPLRKLRDNDEGPVLKPLWDFPMGNSRFDLKFLHDYNEDNIRFCSVYPEIVHRGDGDKLPFTIPSDEWVLISGDHFDNQFAIFAKQPRPNFLSFQVFIRDHRVHIFTRESDNALVAIGDGLEPATEESFRLPTDTDFIWRLKVTKDDDHFVVRTLKVPMTLHIGSNYIAVAFESDLQGHVSGLCGHFNGNTFSSKSDVYSTKDIDSIK